MQHIFIIIIVIVCGYFVGRRLYKNIRSSESSCGCAGGCASCGPGSSSQCPDEHKSDSSS